MVYVLANYHLSNLTVERKCNGGGCASTAYILSIVGLLLSKCSGSIVCCMALGNNSNGKNYPIGSFKVHCSANFLQYAGSDAPNSSQQPLLSILSEMRW